MHDCPEEQEFVRNEMMNLAGKTIENFNNISWIRYRIEAWDLQTEYRYTQHWFGYGADYSSKAWVGFVTVRAISDKYTGETCPLSCVDNRLTGLLEKYLVSSFRHPFSVSLAEPDLHADAGQLKVRHWLILKDLMGLPRASEDDEDCGSIAQRIKQREAKTKEMAEQIVAKYAGVDFLAIIGLQPIISLDIPVGVAVNKIAEEFNCAVYRKIIE